MGAPSSGKPPGTKPSRVSKRKSSKESPRRPPALLTDASELAFGKIIGRGSQGCVRIARHTATGKRYAVKQLPLRGDPRAGLGGGLGGMAVTDEEARRMEAEAEVLKLASDHPNVVRFHGVFRREGTALSPGAHLCIVMSHCEGGDLASLLKSVGGVPLPEEAIMRWVVQLLLGLAHVHSKAILHRDIKPGNVFLTKSLKVVKIGDFGIAKALTERDDLADTQVGTPLYMSPELCQGKPYTYASDVWALGCTVYEMASGGAKAFDAPGWPQLLVKIVRNDYAPLPSHFSRPFLALVSSMLAPDPADRPTAAQLLGHPLVRRHCEALLSEAASAPGGVKPGGVAAAAADAVAAANATNAQNNPNDASNANAMASFASHTASRVGVGVGVGVVVGSGFGFGFAGGSGPVSAIARVRSIRRGSSSSASASSASSSRGGGERSPPRGAAAGAQRLADAERQRAAEARYAARQAMARRDRMAVRDADPRRIAERARADAEAEARVARQRRRETAAAETALLRDRGVLSSPSEDTHTPEADVREAAAFAARPKLERTTTTGGGDARVARDASPDAETQLMEALMAEARRDAEMEAGDDSNSNGVTRDVSDPGGSANENDDDAPSAALTRASERLAPADRVASAPGGARIRPRRAVSSSFEWPPPEVDSERQATRDAALERRVCAKLRSYLRASCGDAVGDTNGRASFARPATVGIASSGDAGWASEAFEVHEGPLEASETVEEADGEADGGSEEAEEVTEEEELYSDDFDSGDYDDDFFGSESAEETLEDAKDEAEGGQGA
jgi:NIMA (never in mitosis gene a)-related kinase